MDVPALITKARRHSGLSQRILAERAGVSRHAVSHYENGRRSPSIAVLTSMLAAAGLQLRVELEPLDQDVRDAIARLAAEPMADRDIVARWVNLTDLAACPYRVEGPAAACMLGAPLPADYYDLALADTPDGLRSFAALTITRGYVLRLHRREQTLYFSLPGATSTTPDELSDRLRGRVGTESGDGSFWMRSGFAEARVRLAPPEDVARYVEVATPHGPVRVAPLHEITGLDARGEHVLRILREAVSGA